MTALVDRVTCSLLKRYVQNIKDLSSHKDCFDFSQKLG